MRWNNTLRSRCLKILQVAAPVKPLGLCARDKGSRLPCLQSRKAHVLGRTPEWCARNRSESLRKKKKKQVQATTTLAWTCLSFHGKAARTKENLRARACKHCLDAFQQKHHRHTPGSGGYRSSGPSIVPLLRTLLLVPYWSTAPVPSDSTGLIGGTRHYSDGTIEGPHITL